MLSTASRDGSIRVWDRRVEAKHTDEAGELGVATVNQIKNAHGVKGKGAKGVRRFFFELPWRTGH